MNIRILKAIICFADIFLKRRIEVMTAKSQFCLEVFPGNRLQKGPFTVITVASGEEGYLRFLVSWNGSCFHG